MEVVFPSNITRIWMWYYLLSIISTDYLSVESTSLIGPLVNCVEVTESNINLAIGFRWSFFITSESFTKW